MIVKQGRFYLRHNTLSEDAPIAIIFKVTGNYLGEQRNESLPPLEGATTQLRCLYVTEAIIKFFYIITVYYIISPLKKINTIIFYKKGFCI